MDLSKLFLFSILLLVNAKCNRKVDHLKSLTDRCEFYDSIGYTVLEGYQVHRLRQESKSSYEVNIAPYEQGDNAVFRMRPVPEIHNGW